MRTVRLTITTAVLLMALTPGLALAAHRQRAHHSARTHHVRAHRMRIVRFGRQAAAPAQSGAASAPNSTTSPSPAGTVASFTGGVLTITLSDGSMVSGAVTNATEIECMSPAADEATGENGGDDSGQMQTADDGPGGGDQSGEDSSGSGGGDEGDDGNDATNCGTAALTPGTTVQDARLAISGSGSVWQRIDLIQS